MGVSRKQRVAISNHEAAQLLSKYKMPCKEVEAFMKLQSCPVLKAEQESTLIKQLESHDLTKNEKMHIINLLPEDMLSLELVTQL